MLSLRPYQKEQLANVRRRRDCGVYLQIGQSATGTGKSVLFAALYKELGLTKRLLILTHLENLVDAAERQVRRWNPEVSVGVEMANRVSSGEPIVVGSVATLGRKDSTRLAKFNPDDFEAIVVDETEGVCAPTYQRILSHFGVNKSEQLRMERAGTPRTGAEQTGRNRILVLGVTATPFRSDGQALSKFFDEQVFSYPIHQAIADGYLSDLIGLKITTNIDISKVKVRCGDLEPRALEAAINLQIRNELVVKSWQEHALNKSSVAFCVSINHAIGQALAFQKHGINAQPIWGNDPDKEKKLAMFASGQIPILTNAALLGVGWDYPNLQCICYAAPTQSLHKYVQYVGRGTRLQDDITNLHEAKAAEVPLIKESCLILDFVDNSSKHSLMTLPSMFGLNPGLDLAGTSVTKATSRLSKHPSIDFSKLEIITELDSYVERVNLFRGAQTAQQYSVPSWVRTSPRNVIRFNVAKIYAKNVLSAAELNCLTEGQVNAILNAKVRQLREVLKEPI